MKLYTRRAVSRGTKMTCLVLIFSINTGILKTCFDLLSTRRRISFLLREFPRSAPDVCLFWNSKIFTENNFWPDDYRGNTEKECFKTLPCFGLARFFFLPCHKKFYDFPITLVSAWTLWCVIIFYANYLVHRPTFPAKLSLHLKFFHGTVKLCSSNIYSTSAQVHTNFHNIWVCNSA